VTRRMLINAQRPQELRIALTTGNTLDDYQVAVAQSGLTRGNIYRGVVASVQPSLNAAFVAYGAARDGMLRSHDVVPQAYHRPPGEGNRGPRVERVLERGRPLLVQITKDPSGDKGAGMTTNISLAGRYLVLMPYDDVRGISRKVEDEEERREIREVAAKLEIPEGFGFIVRTNALNQNKTALNRDLNALLRLWKRIRTEANQGKGPRLLYSDQDLIVQAVRDMLDSSVDEVLVDDDDAFEHVKTAMRAFMPRTKTRLIRYRERLPLFSRYTLEQQLESIFQPKVNLPAGGSIVIEGTEALTAIDVNSGRSTRGGSQEETAYSTNLEAAHEVARQLRLRDIGGLIVVDFIDMYSRKHQREVEKELREAVKADRARVTIGRISLNGLLEINRQRLKTPLVLRTHRQCPTCGGSGRIPSPETVSLNLMRRIEERAALGGVATVQARLHPELADAFQNDYRADLAALEREYDIRIEIVAAAGLHRSEEEIEWTRRKPKEEEAAPQPAVLVTDLTTGGGSSSATAKPSAARVKPADTENGEESRPKRRRRGGRRRRKLTVEADSGATEEPDNGSDSEPPPAELPSAQEDTDDDSDGSRETSDAPRTGTRRRGRRGGRRRKKPSSDQPAAEAQAVTVEDPPPPHLQEPAQPPQSPPASSPPLAAKRRLWPRIFGEDD
jgi:ribonuclease E